MTMCVNDILDGNFRLPDCVQVKRGRLVWCIHNQCFSSGLTIDKVANCTTTCTNNCFDFQGFRFLPARRCALISTRRIGPSALPIRFCEALPRELSRTWIDATPTPTGSSTCAGRSFGIANNCGTNITSIAVELPALVTEYASAPFQVP